MKDFYKKNKKSLLMFALVAFVVFLSACGRVDAIGPESEGFWDGLIIYNLSRFILWLSDLLGGSYGIAIIVFTSLGQILLLPLTNYQQKSMEKTQEIQPQMEALREKYSARDEATQEKLQTEMKKLQDEAGVNPLAGCLPLLIQMPIFIALYQTVTRTPELATGNFLWLELGQPDPIYILPLLAAAFTLLNSWMMQYGNPNAKSNAAMTYMMPIMIFFITFRVASSLALYFVASNATRVLMTLLTNNPFVKRRKLEEKAREEEEAERRRQRALNRARKTGRSVKK